MFTSRSRSDRLERKANKKTGCDAAHPARNGSDSLPLRKRQRVMRIGAFTRQHPKKLPWVETIATELACLPVKVETRKEVRSLAAVTRAAKNGCCGGVTRPSGRFAGYRPGYTSFSATVRGPFLVFGSFWGPLPGFEARKVGATSDPRHGCSVNTAESASRLIRFTNAPSGRGGLNGWGSCARKQQA